MIYPEHLKDYRNLHKMARYMKVKDKIGDLLLSAECIILCAIIYGTIIEVQGVL